MGETRSVVLAHAFVAGAAPSDSERDISVGGISVVPASSFDGSPSSSRYSLNCCRNLPVRRSQTRTE